MSCRPRTAVSKTHTKNSKNILRIISKKCEKRCKPRKALIRVSLTGKRSTVWNKKTTNTSSTVKKCNPLLVILNHIFKNSSMTCRTSAKTTKRCNIPFNKRILFFRMRSTSKTVISKNTTRK